jgi:hypothetical protein
LKRSAVQTNAGRETRRRSDQPSSSWPDVDAERATDRQSERASERATDADRPTDRATERPTSTESWRA